MFFFILFSLIKKLLFTRFCLYVFLFLLKSTFFFLRFSNKKSAPTIWLKTICFVLVTIFLFPFKSQMIGALCVSIFLCLILNNVSFMAFTEINQELWSIFLIRHTSSTSFPFTYKLFCLISIYHGFFCCLSFCCVCVLK